MKKDYRFLFGVFIIVGLLIICLILPLFINEPKSFVLENRFCAPSNENILGCDHQGNDLLATIAYGGRISFIIGFSALFLNIFIGFLIGSLSGYLGGKVDLFFMRIVDILMAFPGILLAIFISAILGPGIINIILAISITGWTSTARLVRGEYLYIKERDFVHAAKAIGSGHFRVIFKHIFPSIIPIMIIHSAFMLSAIIITESSLSILGLANHQGVLTWGALLSAGKNYLVESPKLSLIPGICIMFTIMSLNFLGDFLRDWLDPKKLSVKK